MSEIINTDIAIIGGGASGLAAAVSAKMTCPQANVVIAERLDRTGKKILVTGNGRCNLSNKNLSSLAYHGTIRNITEIIEKTPDTEMFFRELGVLCSADSEGRIYPYSRSASSVLNALRLRLKADGVEEICGFNAKKIERKKNGYAVVSENGDTIMCRKIIAACGGYAAPSMGTDGSGIRLFKEMGYKTVKICPAVAPLKVSPEQLKGLKGVRVKGNISAYSGKKLLRTETGEIQFTDSTVSGICVFNLAYLFSEYEGRLELKADLMPDAGSDELENILLDIKKKRSIHNAEEFLNGIFVKNLSVYIMKRAVSKPLTEKISSLSRNDISNIASVIKSLDFKVTGCSSWQNAQVTSGGISGECVDASLQSVKDKGIYFAGEMLDADGDCGGYNLEWAWSSGIWAGRNCALSLK